SRPSRCFWREPLPGPSGSYPILSIPVYPNRLCCTDKETGVNALQSGRAARCCLKTAIWSHPLVLSVLLLVRLQQFYFRLSKRPSLRAFLVRQTHDRLADSICFVQKD